MKALSHSRQTNRLQEAYEFKNINKSEHQIKLAIKDVEKKARLKANRDKPLEYVQLSLNRIMLTKVLGRGKLEKEHQAAWKKLKKEYNLKESVNEAKDNLYLQLHKKYADQIKGLKAKKIKKLTDLVSVQRWTMEDEYDNSGFDRKAMSKQFDHERKLFKQYMAGDKTVSIKESRDPEAIRKEYKQLKKQSIKFLQDMWSRSNKVGNPKSLDKAGLISDILRDNHGNKYVNKAFESKLAEGKGQALADKYVAKLRSEFRKLNDDELDEFKKTIAKSLDLS